MTDADVDTKFRDLSPDLLGPGQTEAARHTPWHLEDVDRIGIVMELFTVKR